jgi:PAS domain S-box-containing protein
MKLRFTAKFILEMAVSVAFFAVFLALDRATPFYEISPGVPVWYPPDGLGYALLVAGGWRFAPAFVAAALFSSVVTYHLQMPLGLDILWSLGMVGIYGIAAAAVRRKLQDFRTENATRQFLWSLGVGLVAAAFLAVVSSLAQPWDEPQAVSLAGRVFGWWCGEAIGILTLTPFALVIATPFLRTLNAGVSNPGERDFFGHWYFLTPLLPKPVVALGQIALIAATIWLAVASPFADSFHLYYLCFIPLVWVSIRLGLVGAAVANILINFGAMGALALVGSVPLSVAPIQTFMLVLVATGLVVGLMATSARRAEDQKQLLQTQVADEYRKRGEELRISSEYLNSIINACGYPIFVKDKNFRFVLANDAMCEMLGIAREQIIGNTLGEQLPKDQMVHFLEIDKMVLASGKENQREEPLVGRGGEILTIFTKKTRYVDERGEMYLVGVIADLTDKKKAEDAQNKLRLQLNQAQKMESVGRLAGGVAHDFNNMLTVINSYTEMLLSNLDHGDPTFKKLDAIQKAGLQAGSLTRQLLAFSRRQVLQPRIVDINQITSETHSMLKHLIGEDIAIEAVLCRDLGHVLADPGQISQVIMNLGINARDAMPDGGRITIETSNVELDEGYVAGHTGSAPGPHILLAVSDTGTGMDAGTLQNIFEPFFSTKEPGKGTGLGLSMVYGIVKQSGGSIWVDSEPGRGTTFKIYLPRTTEEPAKMADINDRIADTRGKETILVAEDQDIVRELVCAVLRDNGYRVIDAPDGTAAVALAESHPEPIDLLLADLVMPGIGGQELAKTLSGKRPSLKTMYMSGYTDRAALKQSIFGKGEAFIQKPFKPEELARKVREVLDSA